MLIVEQWTKSGHMVSFLQDLSKRSLIPSTLSKDKKLFHLFVDKLIRIILLPFNYDLVKAGYGSRGATKSVEESSGKKRKENGMS